MSSKYPILPPSKIISVLSNYGFKEKSQKGSHVKFVKGARTVIIPMHKEIARGTLRSILMQAGISIDEFLQSLD
jgi:predicted RNA binding protein YcfA (HicA-like mRNA interferase family)